MKTSYDSIIVGGGPAGSTVAALLAQAGCSVLLVEREEMPRFHVGESLMPETYWIFQRLGVLEKMQRSKFVKKYSVQFVSGCGKQSQPVFFKEHDPRECSQTWQVERADFDHMLFENAREKGADGYDRTRVLDPLMKGTRAIGVRLRTAVGDLREIRAKVVVDASGQAAVLAGRMGVKQADPRSPKAAVWTYYEGASREPDEHGGATIILHTRSRQAWFWWIPLSGDLTSIGLVGDADYLLKGRGTPCEVFEEELVNCPDLVGRLASAALADEFHVAKDFAHTTTQQAGDGWVLVGDALGTVDPVYSAGVYLAMKSGELAADAILQGLRTGNTSARQLGGWTAGFASGARWIDKLADAFYTRGFSFPQFLDQHPQHRGNLVDLLMGRLFHEEAGRLFADMDPALAAAKQAAADRHPDEVSVARTR